MSSKACEDGCEERERGIVVGVSGPPREGLRKGGGDIGDEMECDAECDWVGTMVGGWVVGCWGVSRKI